MPQYRSHPEFNRSLLSNPSIIEAGERRLKSSAKGEVIESQTSSYKTSNMTSVNSYNNGDINSDSLLSIDSCMKTITADALRIWL